MITPSGDKIPPEYLCSKGCSRPILKAQESFLTLCPLPCLENGYVSRRSDCISITVPMNLTSALNVCNYSVILQLVSLHARSLLSRHSFASVVTRLARRIVFPKHCKYCDWTNLWLRRNLTTQIEPLSSRSRGDARHFLLP